jgi:hypothetical protein
VAEVHIGILTNGSSGSLWAYGNMTDIGATPATTVQLPASTLSAITWNSTQANYFSPAASWSAGATGNTYTVYGFHCLQLN